MQKELKEKYPNWVWNINPAQNNLCLTDDCDSLLSSSLLMSIFPGLNINYFYDFNQLFVADKLDKRKSIGVDLSIENGKCFDNHVLKIHQTDSYNKKSANINAIMQINRESYFEKFSGSTLLQIWSLYDIPLPKDEMAKLILICTDSGFKGLYNDRFKQKQIEYLKMLEMEELIYLTEKYTIEEMYGVIEQFKLSKAGKIEMSEDGFLQTQLPIDEIQKYFDFNIKPPEQQFQLHTKFSVSKGVPLNWGMKYTKENLKGIFSFALTNRNYLKFTG